MILKTVLVLLMVPLVEGSLADNMFGEKIDRAVYNCSISHSLETHALTERESVSLGERQKLVF